MIGPLVCGFSLALPASFLVLGVAAGLGKQSVEAWAVLGVYVWLGVYISVLESRYVRI